MTYHCYQCKTQLMIETKNEAAYLSPLYARCPKCNSVSKVTSPKQQISEVKARNSPTPPPFNVAHANLKSQESQKQEGRRQDNRKNIWIALLVGVAFIGTLIYQNNSKVADKKHSRKKIVFTQKNISESQLEPAR